MQQRYTLLLTAAAMLLLIVLGDSMLPAARRVAAQTGGTAAPLPTIVLNVSPVADAIRLQGTAAAQMVDAARAQGASAAQMVDAAHAQGTSAAQLVDAARAQGTTIAQLVQEAQAARTSTAQEFSTLTAQLDVLGRRVAACTITGTGYVEVQGEPDTATAQLDVKTLEPTLDAALKGNAAQVAATKQQLQQTLALAPSAIQAANPQIAPVLGDDRAITAYRVLTPLQITIAKPTSDAGAAAIAQVLALGGSSFKEVTFSLTDPTAFEKQARAQAFVKAKAQAAEYAQMAQGQLGAIISVSEDVNSRREPLIPAPGKPTAPIYNAQVSVVFALDGPCGLPTAVGR